MNLAACIAEWTERPDRPAIVVERRGRRHSVTFKELDHAIDRAARGLINAGIGEGDVVLVLQPMSIELYEALVALFAIGAVAMVLDPSAGRGHVARCCAMAPPKAFIGSPRAHVLRLLVPAVRRIPRRFVIGGRVPGATVWPPPSSDDASVTTLPRALDGDAPALLTFTSGSTGEPKAAVRTHAFLLAQHAAIASTLGLEWGQVDLTTLPIFLLANLASGVTSVVPDTDLRRPGFIDARPVVAQIRRERVIRTVASPAFLECLATECARTNVQLDQLRRIDTGGAPVFPMMLERFARLAPNADIVALYGSTEAEPIGHIQRREITAEDEAAMRCGAGLIAGPPVPQVDLRILPDRWGTPIGPFDGDDFQTQCLGVDHAGEIVVAGDHVLAGYLHGEGDQETKFRVDDRVWHRTGDAGRFDTHGRLWLLGRCAAALDDPAGAGRLYPFGVECAARGHFDLDRVAFVQHAGRRVLVVESTDGPDLDAARAAMPWAAIDAVRAVDRIPLDRRHNAKIEYPALLKMLG